VAAVESVVEDAVDVECEEEWEAVAVEARDDGVDQRIEPNRLRSLRALCITSQPDRTSKPSPMNGPMQLLIVILSPRKPVSAADLWRDAVGTYPGLGNDALGLAVARSPPR